MRRKTWRSVSMTATESTYTDKKSVVHPTLELRKAPDEKYPFTFGVAKAKLILENLEAVKAFADKHKTIEPAKADQTPAKLSFV